MKISIWYNGDQGYYLVGIGISCWKHSANGFEPIAMPEQLPPVETSIPVQLLQDIVTLVTKRRWRCNECDTSATWTAELHEDSGEPVCQECGNDMALVPL